MIYEHHIAHHGIKIHYTTTINPSSKSSKDALPLIIVPGFTEDASDYSELMRVFSLKHPSPFRLGAEVLATRQLTAIHWRIT